MKNLFTIILASFVLFATTAKAQNNCNPFYTFAEGKKWTTANYNHKDKYEGKQSYEILEMTESDNKLIAKTLVKSFDKKDKLQMEKEIEFICEDGVIHIDMSQYLPAETLDAFKNMDVEMKMDPIEVPEKLSVGQQLADGGVHMTVKGPMPMSFDITIEDRKVTTEEEITVPAGTYNTYKITSTTVIDMMGKREMRSAEWIAEGVGAVRTESYDKSGDLKYYTVLIEYSK
jgi:hypothetical protein